MSRLMLWMLVALVMAANPVSAFKETGGGSPPMTSKAQPQASEPLDLGGQGAAAGEPVGSGLRIPGLGTIGVLPKLDFGLELLYGEGQSPAVKPREEEPVDSEGLRIRGTLKHRF